MRYKIYGIKNVIFRRKIREALYFFEEKLKLDEYDYVTVRVKVTKNIDVFGYCSIDEIDEDNCAHTIIMEIQTGQDKFEIIHTLAHEMVHVSQYVTGQLSADLNVWKGEEIDSDSLNYEEHPWEIEAEEIGNELYEAWKDNETI